MKKHYDELLELFERYRRAIDESEKDKDEQQLITESDGPSTDNKSDGIPYNTQDELMSSSIETCRRQFGADFSNFKTPMLYYPQDGDVVLSGEISSLNNAKFQFRLKDPSGDGCYVWTEPIQLTENNINQLRIIYGVYKNWKNDLDTAEDKKPMGMTSEQETTNGNEQNIGDLTPGDDY